MECVYMYIWNVYVYIRNVCICPFGAQSLLHIVCPPVPKHALQLPCGCSWFPAYSSACLYSNLTDMQSDCQLCMHARPGKCVSMHISRKSEVTQQNYGCTVPGCRVQAGLPLDVHSHSCRASVSQHVAVTCVCSICYCGLPQNCITPHFVF